MRTNLEFRSPELSQHSGDEGVPGGKALAELLAERLPHAEFPIDGIQAEDWGWLVQVTNEEFPLWVGCGAYQEYPDGCLCFIEPSKPFMRHWFKRIATEPTVERLADALEQVLRDSGKAYDIRWWSPAESLRG